MSKTTMGVRLDQDTRKRLAALGKLRQRSTHWLMQEAVQRYLDTEEQYEKERAEDQRRWENFVDTGRAVEHAQATSKMDQMRQTALRKAAAKR